jgi:hypothetical protein
MRSTILFSIASLAGVCLVTSGYGCGSSNGTSPGDGGTGAETSSSSGGSSSGGLPSGDASSDTGGDTGMPCTAMPKGMQILSSATASVVGVTSDGQVLYSDPTALSLGAVPIGGGTPAMIGAFNSAQNPLFVVGKVAAYFTGLTQQTAPQYGPLTVWTAAGGAKKISTSSYYSLPGNGAFDISADSSLVLYTDNATATTADIYVAGTDGSNPTKLLGGVSWGQFCAPILKFIGDNAVVGYCTTQPDAGTTPVATIAAFSASPTWQTKQTFANGDGFPVFSGNKAGTMISFVTAGGMYVEPIGGTTMTPTLIDANGTGGLFTNAGTDMLYFDKTTNLWRSPVATPAPVEVAAGPWIGTLARSSDDKWLELAKTQDSTTGLTDMYLVSTTPQGDGGGAVTTLTNVANGANFFDAFTADNSQALFFTPVDQNGVAPFLHLPLPPAGAPATVSKTGWVEFTTTGTKLVYADNWASGCSGGCADIKGVDVASTTPAPTTLVTGADANFQLSADKKTVVYSWNYCAGVTGGIYTIAAP